MHTIFGGLKLCFTNKDDDRGTCTHKTSTVVIRDYWKSSWSSNEQRSIALGAHQLSENFTTNQKQSEFAKKHNVVCGTRAPDRIIDSTTSTTAYFYCESIQTQFSLTETISCNTHIPRVFATDLNKKETGIEDDHFTDTASLFDSHRFSIGTLTMSSGPFRLT